MVKNKNKSRKIKGSRKYYRGGESNKFPNDISVIPENNVQERIDKYEMSHSKQPEIEHDTNVETEFQFTRHVLSCNNISQGKGYSIGKDFEPGATVYGIFETINYAEKENQKRYFNYNHVYVSNLYRTWITAVLLYGTNLKQNDTLNLYVSPHLKEFHKTIAGFSMKRGNFPKEISHMGAKFLKFLNTLKEYSADQNASNVSDQWFENLPNKIILHLPPDNKEEQKVTYQKNGDSEYTSRDFCSVSDTAGENSGEGFTTIGDLQDFMDWYNSSDNYHKTHEQQNKVHIITHSHIMRDYLTRFQIKEGTKQIAFDLDALKKDERIQPIRDSNCWHFVTTKDKMTNLEYENIDDAIQAFDLQEGVQIEKTKAEKLENTFKTQSLCGTQGSIHPSQKCPIKGGRKTHKKRYSKEKKYVKKIGRKSCKKHK